MSKKTNRTVPIVGIGIVLIALAIVLSAVLAPRMSAGKALNNYRKTLSRNEAFTYVSILDPLDHAGPLLPQDTEARLTDTAEIEAVRDRLLTFVDGAKYRGVKEAISGNWDIRVRFADGAETVDIYLCEDSFYFAREGKQFVFAPQDAAEYTVWRTQWLSSLFGEKE